MKALSKEHLAQANAKPYVIRVRVASGIILLLGGIWCVVAALIWGPLWLFAISIVEFAFSALHFWLGRLGRDALRSSRQ